MLDLRINNTPLDLDTDTEVQITASNPLFDRDNVERIFSYPFRLPNTPHNRRTRRHANRLDAANKTTTYPARVSIETHLLLSGKATQTDTSDTGEEITVANTPLEIWKKLQKIKINEILETLNLLDGETPPYWDFGLGSPGSYSITVHGTTATASAGTFPDIAAAGASLASQLNTAFPGIATYDSGSNTLTLDGFLVKEHPIEAYATITLNGWKNIALYHYNAVRDHVLATNATPIGSHCFPVIRWPGLYGQFNSIWDTAAGFVNNAADGTFYPNVIITSEEKVWQNTVIPTPRVPYILEKIAEALGTYIWAGDVWDDADFQKLIVVNNFTLDAVTEDQYDDLEFYKINSFTPEINLNKHVPALTAADFITALCNTFALYLSTGEGQLLLVKKQTRVTAAPINLDGHVSSRYQIQPNFTDGWRIAVTPNENEAHTDPDQLQPVSTGAGEGEILTANTLYFDDSIILTGSNLAKLPYTHQPGACPVFQSSANKTTMPLSLLFCYELQPTFDDSEYIFASHDNLNYDGDPVGAYSLAPDGTAGLYTKWHKGVVEYTIADRLIVTAYLTIGQVQKILSWRHALAHYYHPDGVVNAAIREIQVRARSTGLTPVRIELLQ